MITSRFLWSKDFNLIVMRNSQNCTFSFDPMLESLKYSPVQKVVISRIKTKQITQAPYSGPRDVVIANAFSCYIKKKNGKQNQ